AAAARLPGEQADATVLGATVAAAQLEPRQQVHLHRYPQGRASGPAQNQLRHLRPAVEAHRVFAAQATADVQQRRRLVEQPAVVSRAIEARHGPRAQGRDADLAAVDWARQHQVDAVAARPGHVVGRVAQAQAEDPLTPTPLPIGWGEG